MAKVEIIPNGAFFELSNLDVEDEITFCYMRNAVLIANPRSAEDLALTTKFNPKDEEDARWLLNTGRLPEKYRQGTRQALNQIDERRNKPQ